MYLLRHAPTCDAANFNKNVGKTSKTGRSYKVLGVRMARVLTAGEYYLWSRWREIITDNIYSTRRAQRTGYYGYGWQIKGFF